MSQHTPGPWKNLLEAGVNYRGEGHITITDKEQTFAICRLEEDSSESPAVMEANARLITAAPSLFNALEGFITLIEEGILVRNTADDNNLQKFLEQGARIANQLAAAKSAIDKARGES